MTSVTLILDTYDSAKHNRPPAEFEIPWGQIGQIVFRIQRKDNPAQTAMNVVEQEIARRIEELIANYMLQFWENWNKNNPQGGDAY